MKILVNGGLQPYKEILSKYPIYQKYMGFLQTPRQRMSFDSLLHFPFALPIMSDNSAFHGLDIEMYSRYIESIPTPSPLEWITAPDIVGNAKQTLHLFYQWYDHISHLKIALVGQDGAEDLDLPFDLFDCLFIGGTTNWKLSQSAASIAKEAKRLGKMLHMGRVNSDRRLRHAYDLGCDSVDGTGYSRFSKKHLLPALNYLDGLHKQLTIVESPR